MAVRTTDLASDFLTIESLGRTQELTPEGFLLCRDVPIARTGEMLYSEDELPGLEAGKDGILRVTRGPEDLFRSETLASFNGKPVCNDHPDEDVTPDNWRTISVGIVLNPRRGEGADNFFMLADLLITDVAAIKEVREGKREVSNGYDAEYEQDGPGRARQINIIGNHVALVAQGRCGPRCAIGDSDMKTNDKKRTWADRVRTAFKARDEEALSEALTEAQDEMTNGVEGESGPDSDGEHRIVIEVRGPNSAVEKQEAMTDEEEVMKNEEKTTDEEAPAWFSEFATSIEARLAALEGKGTADESPYEDEDETSVEEETKDELDPGVDNDENEKTEDSYDEDEDEEEKVSGDTKTRDSRSLSGVLQDFRSRAEILVPGISLPTIDAKDPGKRTVDRICKMRRRVLQRAFENADTRRVIEPITGRAPKFGVMTCDAAKVMFTSASELVKRANSAVLTTGFVHDHGRGKAATPIQSMNEKNRDFWKTRGGLK